MPRPENTPPASKLAPCALCLDKGTLPWGQPCPCRVCTECGEVCVLGALETIDIKANGSRYAPCEDCKADVLAPLRRSAS